MPADILGDFLNFFNSKFKDERLYIIIDEYDNYTNSILEGDAKLFTDILGDNGFIKDFYETIKTSLGTIVDRVFITGVCSVSLDSMTSGFNVAKNITTFDEYNEMTALTHEEVKELIKTCIPEDAQDKAFNDMKEYYDGYQFSENGDLVFNPNLTMYYLNSYITSNHPP